MSYERRQGRSEGGGGGGGGGGGVPGKRTLVQRLAVQRRPRPVAEPDVQDRAAAGVAGPGGPLPFADRIGAAFGAHDLSAVRAHTDGAAQAAAADLGARAYATGTDVAFAGPPDLHTAAHEAAHVIQQRGGVSLAGGVGADGDVHERHADAVADAVVAGRSAEALLDQHAGDGASAAPAVQRITAADLATRGDRVTALAATAPTEGAMLWKATSPDGGATIYLLGTGHSLHLKDVRAVQPLLAFLEQERFSHVYSEMETAIGGIKLVGDVAANLALLMKPVADRKAPGFAAYRAGLVTGFGGVDAEALDGTYAALALTRGSAATVKDPAKTQGLETDATRATAATDAAAVATGLGASAAAHGPANTPADHAAVDADTDNVKAGDQRALFGAVGARMKAGRDWYDVEHRNQQWVKKVLGDATGGSTVQAGDKQLWIVGASHLPGLVLRFTDLGWVAAAHGLVPVAAAAGSAAALAAATAAAPPVAHGAATTAAAAAPIGGASATATTASAAAPPPATAATPVATAAPPGLATASASAPTATGAGVEDVD